MCAEILLSNDDSNKAKPLLRKVINKQDVWGRTPLYLAAKDWPQDIVQSLLRLGADISIPNYKGSYPLKRIKEDTLLEVLNTHCMESKALLKLGKKNNHQSRDEQNIGNQVEKMSVDEKKAYEKLMKNYEPRFMTHIGHTPVTFDYELLAPTRYDNSGPLNTTPTGSTDEYKIRLPKQPEMEVLSQLCKSKAHQNLIKHPVIKSWVWLKWNRVHKYYHKELRLDFLLMWFMTWYVIQTYGGFEWNHVCVNQIERQKNAHNINWTWTTYTTQQFCDYYDPPKSNNSIPNGNPESLNVTNPYGHLESLNVTARVQYHWNYIFNNVGGNHLCAYTRPMYLMFLVIGCGMIYWMVVDAVEMFTSPNPYKRPHARRSNIFFTKFVPLLAFIRDFVIIMIVVILADGTLWIAITMLFISMLLGEINQFIVMPRRYFLSPKNWSDITQLILIAVIMYVPNEYMNDPFYFIRQSNIDKICHPEGETKPLEIYDDSDISVKRGLAAFLIVLSWSRLLLQVASHPSERTEQFNKYVMMYQTVAKSFMKLAFVYGLFVISFSIGFYILFHEDIGEDRKLRAGSLSSYVFFESPYEAFAKTIAMFIGEVDFNNMPIGISYSRRDGNISVTLAYLFFLTFIFMCVMVLMNLLNGLAVSDIAEIVAQAEIKHQISMINILKEYEDRAINNKIALEFFGACFPCLKGLFAIFDFEQELKIFPETQKMEPIDLPYKEKENENRNWHWLYMTQRNKKLKVGYEHILSEARKILYQNQQS